MAIFSFGCGQNEGGSEVSDLLGAKGAMLMEMSNGGLPVPPGLIISSNVCVYYLRNNRRFPPAFIGELNAGLEILERATGKEFGGDSNPLLVSLRTSSRSPMPGLMDTILNIGCNDAVAQTLSKTTGNPRFAWDTYRRFIQTYCDTVLAVFPMGENSLEELLEEYMEERELRIESELTSDHIQEIIQQFKVIVRNKTGAIFPTSPQEQITKTIGAAFDSWLGDRPKVYRQKYGIRENLGTAVIIQSMVFGNAGVGSGAGVAFTRNPVSGINELYGEFLENAHGHDVVAGVRVPTPVIQMRKSMPRVFQNLLTLRRRLERHFCDMQDFEFTVENEKLFLLQCRPGKRTALAAVRIAVDLVEASIIPQEVAIRRIPAERLDELFAPIFDPNEERKATKIAIGLPAGPGVASGRVCFSSDRAVLAGSRGEKVVLVRNEVSPEDLRGIISSEGVLTAKGGVSSHAALIARQMGKVCVAGASGVTIDYNSRSLTAGGEELQEGDFISINGFTGEVYAGSIRTVSSLLVQALVGGSTAALRSAVFLQFQQLMTWADQVRVLKLRANASTISEISTAIALGAEGIGLCRTEHMFFDSDRIDDIRWLFVANDANQREFALAKLLPYQEKDFEEIFDTIGNRPITIRLFDFPIHEYLPYDDQSQKHLALKLKRPVDEIRRRVAELHEFNPMLGIRGCRFSIVYPAVTEMQAEAIFRSMIKVKNKSGKWPNVEILIPFVSYAEEARIQYSTIARVSARFKNETGEAPPFRLGTLIELPRAALTADELAKCSDFLSIEENDLTQTTLAFSRDDFGSFMNSYLENEVLHKNPFASIDQAGVGLLIAEAVQKARSVKAQIEVGSCGETSGDPTSIRFLHRAGISWISCSPFRLPIAKLAAAQAALAEKWL